MMQRQPQRLLSLLLAFVMLLTCAPTAFAESTEAAMMRLMKTEGTVSVTNGRGRSVTTRDEMRLNNGYGLTTGEASYAWINLDDAKLVKMDAVTEISIRKSGKKLDILVDSGSLFFNVSKPLEEDETLNIRTSTMAVGVRGTCGWVKVIDQWTTLLYILEGTVEVTVTDPVTGETKTETVKGGEMVTCKVYPQDTGGSKCDIIRQNFTVSGIDGFVLVELVQDISLCEKIYEDSGLDILGSGVNPSQKLKEDQEAVHNRLEEISGKLAAQENNISKDPVWTNPVSDGTPPSDTDSDDSTGGGGEGGTTSTVPTETVTLTMPQTAAVVNETLGRASVRQVVLRPGVTRSSTATLLEVDSYLTVPSGKTLTLQSGVGLTAADGRMLAVHGALTVSGDFRLVGDLAAGSAGVIKSTAFKLAASVVSWKVSSTTDGAGYYTLIYSPKGAYTVTFNANGGTVTPASATTVDSFLLSWPVPIRDGYTFDGWYTEAVGGDKLSLDSSYARDTTIYAHWTPGISHTITFDANGGSVSPATAMTGANGRLSSLPTPVRDGYAFLGWYTAAAGGAQVTTGTWFSTDTTIYAYWTPESTTGVTCRYDEAARTLYIEGSGPMPNYSLEKTDSDKVQVDGSNMRTNAPWASYYKTTEAIIIEDGITSVGQAAFGGFTSLKSATIPDSVTSIGSNAFHYCISLTSIKIPDGVTTIGYSVFYNNNSLTSITIPVSVKSIDTFAFWNCIKLKDVYYGGTRADWRNVSIGKENTYLKNATIHCTDDSTEEIGGEAGENVRWSYDPDTKTLTISGSGPMKDYVFLVTDVTSAPWATYAAEMQSLVIEDGVSSIGDSAFGGCSGLVGSLSIPNSVTSIGQNAFRYCSGLTGDLVIPSGVTVIQYLSFAGCSGLTGITIPDSVTAIETGAFSSCSGLTDVAIPDSVTTLGMEAFISCKGLTHVTLPSSISIIRPRTFGHCDSLTSITIPDSVDTIGEGAFWFSEGLTSITIPVSVTTIGESAFSTCMKLTDVYYTGTETQWSAITIGGSNYSLTNATKHYNATGRSAVSYSAPTGYTDVPATAFYAEAVQYCKDNGLMTGTSATTFSPDGTLTRAMMVTVLHRLAGKPFAYATSSFSDVAPGKWYTEAISWASGKGIVNGYDSTTFGTNDPVTHEQVGLILQRYSGDPSVQVSGADSPKSPATRGEVAVTLMNYAKSRKPGTLSDTSAIDVMCAPSGIALDKDANLMVTDVYGKQLWRVQNRNGTAYAGGATVLDLYGQPMGGYNDASLQNSYFKEPWAIAPFLDGWAVSDTANNVVRLVSSHSVQTLNGATREELKVTDLGVAFSGPTGLAADDSGNLYVSDTLNGAVRRVNPQGGVMTVAKNLAEPTGLCWKDGVLYIAETGRNRIVKLEKGKVTLVAGSGEDALTDGSAQQAAFSAPKGVAVGDGGSVYVADTGNGAVRMVKGGVVTTLAARDPEQLGGGLMSPTGLLVRGNSLYICDTFARRIFVFQQ